LLSAPHARAHTPLLSVLTIRERSRGEFVTSWESTQGIKDISAAYDLLEPVFPEHCRFDPPILDCGSRGLSGRVGFDGLANLSTSGMIKIEWADGRSRLVSLTASQPHVWVSEASRPKASLQGALDFVRLGVTHIWLGLDHLLFVLGLLWFLDSWRALFKTITAFTIAHSLTLGAASFGFRILPVAPVEATIALSIAFVAVEAAREKATQRASLTRRYPWFVAFAFGLLHGFGFASALSELHIDKTELPVALFGFNLGVEIGQLVFVAAVLALRPAWRRLPHARLAMAGCYAMGTLAMYWFFERIALFLPG
jgi:hypothetical protein